MQIIGVTKFRYTFLITLYICLYIFSLYYLVKLDDGLTQAETCRCNYVFNRQALCLTGIYWLVCLLLQLNFALYSTITKHQLNCSPKGFPKIRPNIAHFRSVSANLWMWGELKFLCLLAVSPAQRLWIYERGQWRRGADGEVVAVLCSRWSYPPYRLLTNPHCPLYVTLLLPGHAVKHTCSGISNSRHTTLISAVR